MRMPSFFLSVMPSKDLAPFSYISPQKTLFSMIKYALTIGVDEMRVKISPLVCRLGLVLRLGSV